MEKNSFEIPSTELLIDYLDGILSSEALEAMNKRIAENENLATIVEGLEVYYEESGRDREALEQYITQLKNRFDTSTTIKSKLNLSIWKIAAGLAFLLVASYGLFRLTSDSSMDKLIATELSKPYPAPDIFRDQRDSIESLWVEASSEYKEGNYKQAEIVLQNIHQILPEDIESQFYLGLCNLLKDNPDYDRAISIFGKVILTEHTLANRSNWYLSLIYLKRKQFEKAIPFLKTVEMANGFKSKEAMEILTMLE